MSISLVQKVPNSTTPKTTLSGTSLTSDSFTSSANSLIVVIVQSYNATTTQNTPTFADSKSNTWGTQTDKQSTIFSTDCISVHISYFKAASYGSSHTVTVSGFKSSSEISLAILEFSGTFGSDPRTANNTASGEAEPHVTGSISPSGTNLYVAGLAFSSSGTTVTLTNGWSGSTHAFYLGDWTYATGATAYYVTTGSQQGSWTNSGSDNYYDGVIVSFAETSTLTKDINDTVNVSDNVNKAPKDVVTDDFNRADADTLGANWRDYDGGTYHGGAHYNPEISSNRFRNDSSHTSDEAEALYIGASFAHVNQWCQATLSVKPSSGNCGLDICETDPNNLYYLYIDSAGYVEVGKCVSGVMGSGTNTTRTITAGDIFKISWDGTNVKAYHNGSEILSWAPSTTFPPNGGGPALWSADGTARWDDFYGGPIFGKELYDTVNASESVSESSRSYTEIYDQANASESLALTSLGRTGDLIDQARASENVSLNSLGRTGELIDQVRASENLSLTSLGRITDPYDRVNASELVLLASLSPVSISDQVNVSEDVTGGISGIAWQATGNGTITDLGGESCDSRGFVYGTTSKGDPGNVAPASSGYDSYTEESGTFGLGTFTGTLTPLVADTTYYVRAWTHNSAGYSYGDQVSFATEIVPVTSDISDTINASDYTAFTSLGRISLSDQANSGEYVDLRSKAYLNLYDQASISENLGFTSLAKFSIFDQVNVTDFTSLTALSYLLCYDIASISDLPSGDFGSPQADIYDQVNVTEYLDFRSKTYHTIYDQAAISDAYAVTSLGRLPTLSDIVNASDYLTGGPILATAIYDNVNAGEQADRNLSLLQSLSDLINASENVTTLFPFIGVSTYDIAYLSDTYGSSTNKLEVNIFDTMMAWEPGEIIILDDGRLAKRASGKFFIRL